MEEPLVKNGETILQAEKKTVGKCWRNSWWPLEKRCEMWEEKLVTIVETLMMNAGETEHCSDGSGDHWKTGFEHCIV